MDLYKRKQLYQHYDLDSSATFSLLHGGENQTYIIDSNKNKFVVRQYRKERYTYHQILAEINWLMALQKRMLVPDVVLNKNGEWITCVTEDGESIHYFVVFRFINGSSILTPNHTDYEKLGSLMLELHEKASYVLKEAPKDWIGYRRPIYNEQKMIQEPLEQLLNTSFLSYTDKNNCMKLAERIQELTSSIELGEKQFVHGDIHFGNILGAKEGWYLLDFDECGFGYKEFDIGVPRLHLLAAGQLTEEWGHFMSGYQKNISESAIRAGTSARIFYMAGKIPLRLDIENIRKQPANFIQRYIRYIEEELSGETII
ncbi:phosphotransferase enzyme family protein [Bacillus sp. NPDC094106]|uniref:phosphotransferase enzyme family protein n=1 Tax=Bacillus sp. NPDC094106 TaxID=3363949 RepID=UPI0037F863D9